VATFAVVELVVLETCVIATVSPGSPTEIATENFRERPFHALG
jgi:hypothetical protein